MAVRYQPPFLRTGQQIGLPFLVRLSIKAGTPVMLTRGNFRATVTARARPQATVALNG